MSGKRRVYPGNNPQTPAATTGQPSPVGIPSGQQPQNQAGDFATPFSPGGFPPAQIGDVTAGMQQMSFQPAAPQGSQGSQGSQGFYPTAAPGQPQVPVGGQVGVQPPVPVQPGYGQVPPQFGVQPQFQQQQQQQQQFGQGQQQPQGPPQQYGQVQQGQQPLLPSVKSVQLLGLQPDITPLAKRRQERHLVSFQSPSHQPIPCPSSYMTCSLEHVPKDYGLLQKSKLPFGLVLSPFRELSSLDIMPVMGSTDRRDHNQPVYPCPSICRCRRCRAYINPYVSFVDNSHWRCNFCYLVNDLPNHFDYDVRTQQYVDRFIRPEIKYSMIEYVAPNEYMVRPPQPVIYLFLVDVSAAAVSLGLIHAYSKAMADTLLEIPNEDERAKIGFIFYDHLIRFISIDTDSQEFSELVVGDLDEVFVPSPDGLLVNIAEAKDALMALFGGLPEMFQQGGHGNALGGALQAGFEMIKGIGGRLIVLNSSLPSSGPGAFTSRADPAVYNTPAESKLLQPQNSFFKGLAIDCSRAQVTVDYFLFGSNYQDLATLSGASRYTSGSQMYYPGFGAQDFEKFSQDLFRSLTRPLGLEAVLRLRASRGIRTEVYHGNFFVRSSDLLALPTVSTENSYGFQMTIEEAMQSETASFQSALLYTTTYGERRIRLMTICVPVVNDLGSVFGGVNQTAMIALLSKMAAERALTSKIEDSREAVVNKLVEVINAWKSIQGQSASGGVCLPETMNLFPVLVLAMTKSLAIGQCNNADVRSNAIDLFRTLGAGELIRYLYPRLYEVHTISGDVGTIIAPPSPSRERPLVSDEPVVLPPVINLTSEKFVRHGVYLVDAQTVAYLWISRQAAPALLMDLLNMPYEAIQSGKQEVPVLETAINIRVRNIIASFRHRRWPQIVVVKEDGDPVVRTAFLNCLVEDRLATGSSYVAFLGEIRDKK
eukprot:Partr_v1_DN28179_c1_g1_i1_m56137 putative SEC24 family, member